MRNSYGCRTLIAVARFEITVARLTSYLSESQRSWKWSSYGWNSVVEGTNDSAISVSPKRLNKPVVTLMPSSASRNRGRLNTSSAGAAATAAAPAAATVTTTTTTTANTTSTIAIISTTINNSGAVRVLNTSQCSSCSASYITPLSLLSLCYSILLPVSFTDFVFCRGFQKKSINTCRLVTAEQASLAQLLRNQFDQHWLNQFTTLNQKSLFAEWCSAVQQSSFYRKSNPPIQLCWKFSKCSAAPIFKSFLDQHHNNDYYFEICCTVASRSLPGLQQIELLLSNFFTVLSLSLEFVYFGYTCQQYFIFHQYLYWLLKSCNIKATTTVPRADTYLARKFCFLNQPNCYQFFSVLGKLLFYSGNCAKMSTLSGGSAQSRTDNEQADNEATYSIFYQSPSVKETNNDEEFDATFVISAPKTHNTNNDTPDADVGSANATEAATTAAPDSGTQETKEAVSSEEFYVDETINDNLSDEPSISASLTLPVKKTEVLETPEDRATNAELFCECYPTTD